MEESTQIFILNYLNDNVNKYLFSEAVKVKTLKTGNDK